MDGDAHLGSRQAGPCLAQQLPYGLHDLLPRAHSVLGVGLERNRIAPAPEHALTPRHRAKAAPMLDRSPACFGEAQLRLDHVVQIRSCETVELAGDERERPALDRRQKPGARAQRRR